MGKKHIVKRGECLSMIAKQYGFANWRTIYDYDKNEKFRSKRKNPNQIYPGDVIFIPDPQSRTESGETENVHYFRTKAPRVRVRFVVRDDRWEPLPKKEYKLALGDHVYEGSTDDKGFLEQPAEGEPPISPTIDNGTLSVSLGEGGFGDDSRVYVWNLRLGHLDPDDTVTGMQERLNNLGIHFCPADGRHEENMQDALNAFRARVGLEREELWEVDDRTRDLLEATHDKRDELDRAVKMTPDSGGQ